MAQTLLGLGSHFFYSPRPGEASPGFQTMSRDMNWTWVAQPRLSREHAHQFTGIGEKRVQIEGRLYPHLFGGLKTLDNLEEAGDEGKPLLLTRYYVLTEPTQYVGEMIGRYGLTRLRRNELRIGSTGLPVLLDFTLELIKFGDDSSSTDQSSDFLFT